MNNKQILVEYRLERAKDTYDDALILADKKKWNSTINRLYYSAYYAVMALLINYHKKPATHNGAKIIFSEEFVKKGIISKDYGKMFSQLYTWRQKGDYDDLFDFDEDKVLPYFEPVSKFIENIEQIIKDSWK